jgi:hypothetical protein
MTRTYLASKECNKEVCARGVNKGDSVTNFDTLVLEVPSNIEGESVKVFKR